MEHQINGPTLDKEDNKYCQLCKGNKGSMMLHIINFYWLGMISFSLFKWLLPALKLEFELNLK